MIKNQKLMDIESLLVIFRCFLGLGLLLFVAPSLFPSLIIREGGTDIEGADQVWLIIYGSQVEGKGEVKRQEQLYTSKVVELIKSITF